MLWSSTLDPKLTYALSDLKSHNSPDRMKHDLSGTLAPDPSIRTKHRRGCDS